MPYKKFAKDIGVLFLTQMITVASGIIILPIITKLLGAENYGIWVQLLITLSLVSSAIINLPYGFIRFLPGEKDKNMVKDEVWSVFAIMLGVLLIISASLAVFSSPIAGFLKCPRIFILLLSIILLFDYLIQLFYNVLRAFQEIRKHSAFNIFQKLIETGFLIFSITSGYGLLGAIISLLLAKIIIFMFMGILTIKKVGISVPKFSRIKEYISFCLPLIPGDAASWVIQSSDKYFIGFFIGNIFVGYYAPAYTLGSFLTFFLWPLSFLLPATLSKHYDLNEIDKVKTYLKYSLKLFLMIAIPGFFGLLALSKQFLSTLSTPEIAQNSYYVVPFVALSMLIAGTTTIASQIIFLKNKTNIGATIIISAAILNIGLNFIFVPAFGMLGAAITTLLAYAFVSLLYWYYAFKKLNFKFEIDWWFILKSLCASLLMISSIFWLNPLGWVRTLAVTVLGAAIYFIILVLLKGFGKKDINLLKSLIAQKT